jgi:hypothetical protein
MTRISFKAALSRLQFTLTLETVILIVALLTNPSFGKTSAGWIERLGYAPHDLFHGGWYRLITSTLVITNTRSYIQAFLTIGLAGGITEWVMGSRLTAFVFWGADLAATIGESLIFALPLFLSGSAFGREVFTMRNIGASAGYFGLTALACTLLPRPWRWVAASLVLGFLLSIFVVPTLVDTHTPDRWLDGIAHIIAFVVGYFAPRATLQKRV